MNRNLFISLLAFAGLLGLAGLLWLLLLPLLPGLSWAAVIVIATYPLYQRLHQWLSWHATWAALGMTLLSVVVLLVPASLLALTLIEEASRAADFLQRLSAQDYQTGLERVLDQPWIAAVLDQARVLADRLELDVRTTLIGESRRALSFLFGSLGGFFGTAASLAVQLPVMLFGIFFFYRDGKRLTDNLWQALPIGSRHRQALRLRLEGVVSAVVIGILGTAVVQGLLAGAAYWFVGLASPVLLGVLTAIVSIVPVVGTVLVWLPAGIYLMLSGETFDALILMAWGAIVVGGSDNLLRPMLTSSRTGLPFSLRMLGLVAGLATFGVIGLVLGPLLLATAALILGFYFTSRQEDIVVPDAHLPPQREDRRRTGS